MNHILDGMSFVLGLALVPYAIAVGMPTWRWLLGVTLVIGGPVLAVSIQHWIVSSRPDYQEGVGGALGVAFFYVITLGFAAGVGVRTLTLVLAAKGLSLRSVCTICVAGFAIVPAVVIGPAAWHAWKMRPPSEACAAATFDIKVANADFTISAVPIFTVYLGKTSRYDAYYFQFNPGMRTFCTLSDNGRQRIKATHIWMNFDRYGKFAPRLCTDSVADWAKTYCAAYGPAKRAGDDEIRFPLDIHIFAPDEVTMGEFGGSRSTYEEALNARPRPHGPVFFKSAVLTPDQQPLTFECSENGSGYWCKTSYLWSDGAILQYGFRSGRDDAVARGNRIDVETRKFLSGLKV
jgi:hypothetical protein